MEIEKKYKIKRLPENLEQYPCKQIEQGYLCTEPVVRIRKSNESYILTYKSIYGIDQSVLDSGCVANELEAPLSQSGYEHLKTKVDDHMIIKKRYLIPLQDGLKAELDIFEAQLVGLCFVEVEFPSLEAADSFVPPEWFGEDVSFDKRYKNNFLAKVSNFADLDLI